MWRDGGGGQGGGISRVALIAHATVQQSVRGLVGVVRVGDDNLHWRGGERTEKGKRQRDGSEEERGKRNDSEEM